MKAVPPDLLQQKAWYELQGSHLLIQHLCPMAGLVSGVNNGASPAPPPWCCMDCHLKCECLFRKNWVRAQPLKPLRLDKILALLSLKSCSLEGSSFTTLNSDCPLNDHGNYSNQLLSATLRKGMHICLKDSYVFCCAVWQGFRYLEDVYVCLRNWLAV